MRKLLLWLLVVLLSMAMLSGFLLAGCKKEEAAETTAAETTAAETTAAETTAAETTAAAEVVNLTFWDLPWGPADTYIPTAEKLVERFNSENPNIRVEYESIPWDGFNQAFITAIKGGEAPDIATVGATQPFEYADMGEILDLSSIVEEFEKEGKLDDFIPGSIEFFQYNDIQTGIPWNSDPRVISYRKDVFDNLGIEKLPETWDDFLNVCRTIKDNTDMTPLVFPGSDTATDIMLILMYSNNVGIVDPEMKASFNDPKTIEALDFFRTLYKEGFISESTVSYNYENADTVFIDGKAAIIITSLQWSEAIRDKIAVMPPLLGPNGTEKRMLVWQNPLIAFKQTENPEEVKLFIKWYSENMLEIWTEGLSGSLPVRYSYLEDSFFDDPYIQQVVENVFPYAVPLTWPLGWFSQLPSITNENIVGAALQEILIGNTDIEGIASNTNTLIEERLNQ